MVEHLKTSLSFLSIYGSLIKGYPILMGWLEVQVLHEQLIDGVIMKNNISMSYTDANDEEYIIEATVQSYIPANFSGGPDTWSPAEGGEIEDVNVWCRNDDVGYIVKPDYHGMYRPIEYETFLIIANVKTEDIEFLLSQQAIDEALFYYEDDDIDSNLRYDGSED